MKKKIFVLLALPFFIIGLSILSFNEGGLRRLVYDWKEFFRTHGSLVRLFTIEE